MRTERRTFRHEVNFIGGAQHDFFRELFFLRHQAISFANPQHADGIVQRVAVQHNASVRRVGQLADNGFPVIVNIDTDNIVARDHDVVNADFLEVQNGEQHVLIAAGDLRA